MERAHILRTKSSKIDNWKAWSLSYGIASISKVKKIQAEHWL